MAKQAKQTESKPIVVQQLKITQVNRTSQDIQKWRDAIRAAEGTTHNRTTLYDLYSDLLLDGHLSSVIDKRITQVINTPIIFAQDGEEDEVITNMLQTEDFLELIAEILNSRFWGHTLCELQFMPEEIDVTLIPRKHVIPERSEIKIRQSDPQGFSYKEPPYVDYVIEAGKSDDFGLLMKAAQYVIYKRGGFGDYAQFAELFGMPFRKFTYDGYDDKVRQLLEQAAEAAGSAPYAILPKEAGFELVPNNSSGSNETYTGLIEACNAEISKLIVGQTMTTEDGSSLSQSATHMKIQDEIHYADKQFVLRILNHKLRPLLEKHGFKIGEGSFEFVVSENLAKEKMITIDMQLAKQIPISDDYFYETYGIPKPDNYDELKAEKQAQAELMQSLMKSKGEEPTAVQKSIFRNMFDRFF